MAILQDASVQCGLNVEPTFPASHTVLKKTLSLCGYLLSKRTSAASWSRVGTETTGFTSWPGCLLCLIFSCASASPTQGSNCISVLAATTLSAFEVPMSLKAFSSG